MITFLRFVFLILFFAYSCALLASILHVVDHGGAMNPKDIDLSLYLSFFTWPAILLGIAVLILSTPFGDFIIGLCLPTRKQALREEQKIAPALDVLKERYQEQFRQTTNPRAYVMDLPNINGLAFGRNTIAVSSGLLKVASDEEIMAILAHEIGHLHNRDGFFSVALMVALYPTFVICMLLCGLYAVTWLVGFLIVGYFAPILAVLSVAGWCLIWLFFFLDKITRWPIEYKADQFAGDMGFAPALISLFERIEDEDVRGEEGFLAKYAYSHPPTALRIDRLERKFLEDS